MVTGLFFVFGRRCLIPPLGRHERVMSICVRSGGGRQPISTKPQIVSAKPAQCQNVMHHYAGGPREPCRFRKLAEHTAQQVEHRERTIECQYLARLMRALAPIRNSNSSSMIPQHKACAGQSLHPNWGVRKRRWVQGRLDDQNCPTHAGEGKRWIAEVSWSGAGAPVCQFRDSTGDPGRVWSVDQADLSAGGGGETLCRIPVQHRDLVDHGRIPAVLQHVRARALDRPGFCQPRAAAWQWQITRTGVIPSTMACVFASISCAGSNTIWWSRAGTSHESAHARDHDSSRLRDLDDAGRRNVWPVTSLCMHRHQEAPLTKSCAQVEAEVRPPET
jgi:hypothetical protein